MEFLSRYSIHKKDECRSSCFAPKFRVAERAILIMTPGNCLLRATLGWETETGKEVRLRDDDVNDAQKSTCIPTHVESSGGSLTANTILGLQNVDQEEMQQVITLSASADSSRSSISSSHRLGKTEE